MTFFKGSTKPATSGRKKGVVNKATSVKAAEIAKSGLTPLEYMLRIMRDENNPKLMRLDAAKSAAPYVHPRMNAVELTGQDGGPIQFKKIVRLIVDPIGLVDSLGIVDHT